MRIKPILDRGITLVVIALLISLTFIPSLNAKTTQSFDSVEIMIESYGFNDKELLYSLNVSSSQALEIKKILDKQTKSLEKATSYYESMNIMKDILNVLEEYSLINEEVVSNLVDYYQKCDVDRTFLNYSSIGIIPNILSFLILHCDDYVADYGFIFLIGGALGLIAWTSWFLDLYPLVFLILLSSTM